MLQSVLSDFVHAKMATEPTFATNEVDAATAAAVSPVDVISPAEDVMDESVDAELEAMKKRVLEMEAEAAKLKEMQAEVEKEMGVADAGEKEEVDARSVYVGNVDYGSTPEDLQAYFQSCGTINRVTILCDKYTGHPKGFAYIEFADPDAVPNAVKLDETMFKNRLIKVTPKRTNVPGMKYGGRGRRPYGGGPGGYHRGGFRGGYRGRAPYRSRRGFYSPY